MSSEREETLGEDRKKEDQKKEEAKKNPQFWMKGLPANAKIKWLRMIGTHDSAAYKFDPQYDVGGRFKILNSICKVPVIGPIVGLFAEQIIITQGGNIKEQLENGARFIDLRIAYDEKTKQFYCAHSLGLVSLDTVLKDIKAFMEENPTEMVIVHFKADYENQNSINGKELEVLDNFSKGLEGYLWESDGKESLGDKTIGELRGKAIVSCDLGNSNEKLIEWREKGKKSIHSDYDIKKDGVDLVKGQLNMHWENKSEPGALFSATSEEKKSQFGKETEKVLQLDGTATTENPREITGMILSGVWTKVTNIFRTKKQIPESGIEHNAQSFASQVAKDPTFFKDPKEEGFVLTCDFIDQNFSNLIGKAIDSSYESAEELLLAPEFSPATSQPENSSPSPLPENSPKPSPEADHKKTETPVEEKPKILSEISQKAKNSFVFFKSNLTCAKQKLLSMKDEFSAKIDSFIHRK